MQAYKLLTDLENSWDQSFKTKTTSAKTKTAKVRFEWSPDQDCGLMDYISGDICNYDSRISCLHLSWAVASAVK